MSRASEEFDLVVIGGGTGGLSAARTGVRLGARTLLVQDGPIGGDCTFTGCVPSKALIEAAARGASGTDAMAAVHHAVETIARTETAEVLRAEGINVLEGRGRFVAPRELDVDGQRIRAPRVVIATGARPAVPPIDGLADTPFLTNETVFDLQRAPKSLTVLGGGATGCELAQAFRRLGSTVTLIEARARLVAREEPEASAVLEQAFAADGIDLHTGRCATKVHADPDRTVSVSLDDGNHVIADQLLLAVGRRPMTDGLNLEAAGVQTDEDGFVTTDNQMATTTSGIWAVGDIAGKLQFTHAADEMGRIAVGNAFSRLRKRHFNPDWIPSVTYTTPEIGRVGMTEADAVSHGGRVAYLPMTEVDRAIVAGDTQGFVKLVAGPRRILRNTGGGQLLGATVVAARGGEVVHEAVLAMRTRMFTGRLAETVHAYPTWSVAIRQAAAQFFMEIGGRTARPAHPA